MSVNKVDRGVNKVDSSEGDDYSLGQYGKRIKTAKLGDFINDNPQSQALKGKNLWRAIAYVYAERLLDHVRTCNKKDLSSIPTRNLTTSAAIAYDKGFPKDDIKGTQDQGVRIMNNLFLGSEIGAKVKKQLEATSPRVSYGQDVPLHLQPEQPAAYVVARSDDKVEQTT